MLQRFLIIWLSISSLVAFYWPVWFSAPSDPFLPSKPLLPWLIAVTMFAIGMMLPRDEIAQVARRWRTVIGGTAVQYAVMPLLAVTMGTLMRLEGDEWIGIVMVGAVPGAMASNVLTLNARGNTSYSVSLTTVATLLSPLVVPLVLGFALTTQQGLPTELLIRASGSLILTVVLPVIAGHGISRRYPGWEKRSRKVGSIVANLAILWIIATVVALNRTKLTQVHAGLLLALAGVNLGGYATGYVAGIAMRLPEPMRRALTIEVGMQNAGLGATLATQLFHDRQWVAIAPAMYTFGCMASGTLLANAWALASRGKDP